MLVQSGMHLLGIHQPLEKLLTLVQKESCKPQELIETIELDPTLVFEFMQISDATLFSNWHRNLTIELTKAVTIALCIEALRKRPSSEAQSLIKHLWLQSIAMAVACESIVQNLDQQPSSDSDPAHIAYLTGLLSVMGQIQLASSEGEPYREFLKTHTADPISAIAVQELMEEAEQFGKNRFELSADLIDSIDQDPLLSEAIRYHYFPSSSLIDSHWLVRSLALARIISPVLISASNTLTEDCNRESYALLGIDRSQLERIVTGARDRLAGIKLELGILETGSSLNDVQAETDDLAIFSNSVNDASVISVIQGYLEHQQNASDWWAIVENFARLMFGFKNCFLFEFNRQNQMLTASDFCSRVSGFGVAVDAAQSILARCVQDRRIVTSYELPDLAIVDRQLSRLAGGQGLICIPLNKESEVVAVLVGGVSDDSGLRPLVNSNLMTLFSDLIIRQYRAHVLANGVSDEKRSSMDLDYYLRRARELTHEINNPLSIVQNYMKILSLKLDEESSVQKDLETIRDEISRISGIVQKFTALGTADDPEKGMADVNEIIGDIVSVFRGSSPETKFVLQLDDGVPRLNQSRDAIKQILLNLLKNSVEALDESGCIVIGTSSPVNVGGELFVEIMISDDGPGIPEAVEAKLFQEVHSEKGFKHEGLGLSIVKKLVDEMNGLITCRSRRGTGTDFQILIPQIRIEPVESTNKSIDTL